MPFPALPSRHFLLRRLIARVGHWRRRAVFLTGALVVGIAAVGFAIASEWVQSQFARLVAHYPLAPLLLTPLGFALAVYWTRRYFPNAQGSGIPQVIAARATRNMTLREGLVSGRIAVGKIMLTLLGLSVGASTGREGPTVQIGASVMFMAGRYLPQRHQSGLLLAGAAAGVAAAFNTPLAGIVFAIEELSRSFEAKTSGLVMACVIAAGLVSLVVIGDYSYFGYTAASLAPGRDWLAVPLVALPCGLAGGLLARTMILFGGGLSGDGLLGATGRVIKRHPLAFAALCGLGVALCGVASNGTVYGTGYEQAKTLYDTNGGVPQSFGGLKFLALLLSAISGIPGGVFSPSLAVGAGLGYNLATFLPVAPMDAMVLLGTVSFFAGLVQAPMTAFVIVMEMTNGHAMLVPLMIAALLASRASRALCPEGLYSALSRNFAAKTPLPDPRGLPLY